MMYDRMIAPADFMMCSRIEPKRRDSRVFGLVTTGRLAIFSFLLPAWMIVSMQYEKRVIVFSSIRLSRE